MGNSTAVPVSYTHLDYTYTDMASMLSVTNTSDTRMLDITVTNPDPEEAAAIANEYADVGAKYISEKMKTDEPTLMSSARVPENQMCIRDRFPHTAGDPGGHVVQRFGRFLLQQRLCLFRQV